MAQLVDGTDNVIAHLKQVTQKHIKQLDKGCKKGSLFLLNESNKIIPVDHGTLKASGQVRKESNSTPTYFEYNVMYTAAYAVYVHEVPDPPVAHGESFNKKHAAEIAAGTEHDRGSNQVYKFLEKPAREKRREILKIVAKEIKP